MLGPSLPTCDLCAKPVDGVGDFVRDVLKRQTTITVRCHGSTERVTIGDMLAMSMPGDRCGRVFLRGPVAPLPMPIPRPGR